MYSDVTRSFRNHYHETQVELAENLNIKRHTICDWESGRTEPSIPYLKAVAEAFHITVDYLIGFDNTDGNLDHVVLKKYCPKSELEHNLIAQTLEMPIDQQERLRSIFVALKNFNKGEF